MLVLLVSQLAMACLAAAIPSHRRASPNLSIELSSVASAISSHEQFQASTDGTAVTVDSPSVFNEATVKCIEMCILEFHCDLYDKELELVATVNPGTSKLGDIQVGLIKCDNGLKEDGGI